MVTIIIIFIDTVRKREETLFFFKFPFSPPLPLPQDCGLLVSKAIFSSSAFSLLSLFLFSNFNFFFS